MSSGIEGGEGCGYFMLADYQFFQLPNHFISPSPNYVSLLNIDELDHSLRVSLNYKIL